MEKPKIIKSIWDNGGETLDRITVVLNTSYHKDYRNPNTLYHEMLGLSTNGLRYSEFTEGVEGKHLGSRVSWESLPETLQNHIINRLE